MKNRQERLASLLRLLADGNFVSGETLANNLGVTRASVANDIKLLQQWGADIYSVKGRGYKFPQPYNVLSVDAILHFLPSEPFAPINLETSLVSTNLSMKEKVNHWRQGEILLSEIQTQGRGRRGREWLAPLGSGVTFSLFWRFDQGHQSLTGLSLVVGVAVVRALNTLKCRDSGLKWPNDIYVNGAKAGGVLVELEGQLGSSAMCVIGVGLNVTSTDKLSKLDQPFADLTSAAQRSLDRNQVSAALFQELWACLHTFERDGFSSFKDEWQSYDVFSDKRVTLFMGDKQINGTDVGIDNSGALLLKTEQGVQSFHGGEISLRPQIP